MLNAKNYSPRQLSLLTAAIFSVPVACGAYYLERDIWISLIVLSIVFIGSYFLVFSIIQRFIYRKIKLIYKFISQTKASKREEFYLKNILPQKSIEEVSEDVERWAEQKKKEIEILQANEAYRKEFLQNLAHEFKTPVFAIQGYVETLLNEDVQDKEMQKRFLQNTSRNVERLVNLIADLDEISKLESGEQPLHPTSFIIQDLVKEVFEILSIKANKSNIRCVIKKGCESPISVYADKEKIRQVFINLIHNAIKYGKQDGEVEAGIYNIDGKNILIEISDNGIGIPEEHLPRIFERFYRTDYGRSRNIGGTGLGLAICKHIIEAHGHTIHVRSKQDVGTTFGFTLDAKEK
jgi:two-component system phosphate regulon sensor histidine kinase PhoR